MVDLLSGPAPYPKAALLLGVERTGAAHGVVASLGVVDEHLEAAGRVLVARNVGAKRIVAARGVVAPDGVVFEGIGSARGVVITRDVQGERIEAVGAVEAALWCCRGAFTPLAVLPKPMVLLARALKPMAVLLPPVVVEFPAKPRKAL